MRLYIVRHAQSANNALDTPSLQNSGRSADPSLTAKGFQQAEALGRFVGDELGEACGKVEPQHAIRRMVVSPMRRCMLTAGPAAKVLGIPIEVKGDLFEHGGCFEGARDDSGGVVGCTGLTKSQLESEFPGCVVPDELVGGWWTRQQGCETVPQAQERIRAVAAWLWSVAEAWKKEDGAMCIVVHGMFIDILIKVLTGVALTTGKQQAVYCSKNAGVHVLELRASLGGGNVAGLQRFNVLEHMPTAMQTGGSVEGLDDCYMHEGTA
mmetsp:Transcript_33802/g.85126  ORF Transcript_33802/g.85126 Transcript_33802/m.85126 type:complete len:266 (-) Transcript_33802:1547-2344(-)